MGESTAHEAIDPPAAVAPKMSALGRLAASIEENSMKRALSGIVAEHIRAVNAFDTDAVVATFAEDAYVNDNRREIVGIEAVRRWVEKEMVGDKVTIEVREVLDHYGDTIVRGAYDGEYDKTNLPKELILTNYFSVRDSKIVSLTVIFNQPSPY
jgi:hypothetical protein